MKKRSRFGPPRNRLLLGASCFFVCAYMANVALPSTGQEERVMPPRQVVLSGRDGVELVLRMEVIYNPENSTAVFVPSAMDSAPDGTLYVADEDVLGVKVLSPHGERLKAFGPRGEGPGDFQGIQGIHVAASGRLWIVDSILFRVSVFEPDGTFLYSLRYPRDLPRRSQSFVVSPDESLVAFSAGAIEPPLYGHDIHLYRVVEIDGLPRELRYERSLGEVPEYEPALYDRLVGGTITLDPAGGYLFTANNPYELRSYDPEWNLRWGFHSADKMPPTTSYFRVDELGRTSVKVSATSGGLSRLNETYLVNTSTYPPTWDEMQQLPPERWPHKTVFDLVPERRPEDESQHLVFETTERLFPKTRLRDGRFYAYWLTALDKTAETMIVAVNLELRKSVSSGEEEQTNPVLNSKEESR